MDSQNQTDFIGTRYKYRIISLKHDSKHFGCVNFIPDFYL